MFVQLDGDGRLYVGGASYPGEQPLVPFDPRRHQHPAWPGPLFFSGVGTTVFGTYFDSTRSVALILIPRAARRGFDSARSAGL